MKTILEEWLEDPEFRRIDEIIGQQMEFEDRLFAWLQKNTKEPSGVDDCLERGDYGT